MIRLGNLHIKNVGPFEEQEFDFHFDKDKDHPDIHIFTGANGTGKTTILHSMADIFNVKSQRINNFHKRFRNDKSIIVIQVINKKTSNEFGKVISGCNFYDLPDEENLLSNHFKFESRKKLIEFISYRSNSVDIGLSTNIKFAAFGYSGYRLINSTVIKNIDEPNDNPLHLALEFDKKIEKNNNISNWIMRRYAKAAIEEKHGEQGLADRSNGALLRLMESIETLTEGEFTLAIKTNPLDVVTKYHGNEVEFDVLPDGLRSILSWMGDLLMRLDQIPWEDKTIPVNEQDIILFLDEIEVHLHPKWQYRILPLTQKIFPNAQIFITTHSPFILNSIDNAKIYQLETEEGVSKLKKISLSNTGDSYQYIYEEILGVTKRFGIKTEKDLKRFNEIDREIMQGNDENEAEFKEVIQRLANEGEEVTSVISSKLFRLKRVLKKDYLPA